VESVLMEIMQRSCIHVNLYTLLLS